jgi:hypothetical protein
MTVRISSSRLCASSQARRLIFGTWLQWYSFDVIGAITFQQRFGFMEERKDVRDMIAGLEFGLWYGSLVGQIPELHPWILGNPVLNHVMATVPALNDVHRRMNLLAYKTRLRA